MYTTFLEAFIFAFALSLSATTTSAFAVSAARGGQDNRGTVFGLAVLLALWFTLAVVIAKAGGMAWAPFTYGPSGLALFVVAMPVALLALVQVFPAARAIVANVNQAELVGLQGFRMLGWIFLVGWAAGDIPAIFAFPAALGDIWAGFEGLRAARAVRRGDARADRAVWRANMIGLVDFAVALVFGMTTIAGDYKIFAPATANIVGDYPLVIVPTMFVPLFITLHLLSLSRLRQDAAAAAQPH